MGCVCITRIYRRKRHNKPRLELALYARPKHPGTFHWALLATAKGAQGRPALRATKRHVKNTLQNIDGQLTQPWRYERTFVADCTSEPRLLVRVVIGKVVVSDSAMEEIVRRVPIYQCDDGDHEKAASFDCRSWIQAAVQALHHHAAVALKYPWTQTSHAALEYVETKKAEGRWSEGWTGGTGVPVLDLFTGMEIVA